MWVIFACLYLNNSVGHSCGTLLNGCLLLTKRFHVILYTVSQNLYLQYSIGCYSQLSFFFPLSLQWAALLVAFFVSAVFHEVLLVWHFIFVIWWLFLLTNLSHSWWCGCIENWILVYLFFGYRRVSFLGSINHDMHIRYDTNTLLLQISGILGYDRLWILSLKNNFIMYFLIFILNNYSN